MKTSVTAAVAAERVADMHRAAQTHQRARDAATPTPTRTRRRTRPRFGWVTVKRPARA
jgi:hypothetical protein